LFGFASGQRRLYRSRGLRVLVCLLTLPMLLASASRAEVILVHDHCGSLHFHFFDAPHSQEWHHEHEHEHESVPCLCRSADETPSSHADETAPHGFLIHVHELLRASTSTPALIPKNPKGFEFVPASPWLVRASAQTTRDGHPPIRARDGTGPPPTSRVCAILLANHALLL
jgi:hypothetical protein